VHRNRKVDTPAGLAVNMMASMNSARSIRVVPVSCTVVCLTLSSYDYFHDMTIVFDFHVLGSHRHAALDCFIDVPEQILECIAFRNASRNGRNFGPISTFLLPKHWPQPWLWP
jgi:hypothetical protein